MHEMHLLHSLKADLLKSAEENKVKKISKIYLRMGEFSEINPEILKFYFEQEGKETLFEGAEILIDPSEMRELTLVSYDCE